MSETERHVNVTDEQIDQFIANQRRKNTVKATNTSVKQFVNFLQSTKCSQPDQFYLFAPEMLDQLLAKFFVGARQCDGSEYEPDTLTSYQRGIDRFLSERGYQYSICRDTIFKKSQEALGAKRRDLKAKGKGNKSRAAEPLTDDDIQLMRQENTWQLQPRIRPLHRVVE